MTYRSDVDALAARTEALATEVAAKTRELESAKALLDEAVARTKLPVLPNIKVATPCSADWSAMTGDERVRACGACNKNVYNLSSLTRDEAEALIVAKEGKLCVRYFQRKDGTILLKDCSIGIKQKRKRRLIAAGVAALLGGGVFAAIKLSKPGPETTTASLDDIADTDETADQLTEKASEPFPMVDPESVEMLGGIGGPPVDEPPPQVHVKMGNYAGD